MRQIQQMCFTSQFWTGNKITLVFQNDWLENFFSRIIFADIALISPVIHQ